LIQIINFVLRNCEDEKVIELGSNVVQKMCNVLCMTSISRETIN